MHPIRTRVALTLAGLCFAAGLDAQPQGREVLLDVLVAQANGLVIVGLDKEDFIVQEDGAPGYDTKLVAYQDFTRDPQAIAAAIEEAATVRKPEIPARPALEGRPSPLANLPKDRALVTRSSSILRALELIGQAAEGIKGRKNLLLFTEGFGQRNSRLSVPSMQINEAIGALNAGNVAIYPVDLVDRSSPTWRCRP